ncbi:MAG: triose-phosphate isomerase, partial [Alphaproteobacteria bacterium]|nr:triose-phosphate isomerase [Alphaproteobacteria bacterium]
MKIIAANWKMNYAFDEADAWLDTFFKNYSEKYERLKDMEMALCPPAILLDYLDSELMEDGFQLLEEMAKKNGGKIEDFSADEISEILINQRPIKLGAQDCHFERSGSFTGDVSAAMLKKLGCRYVILGHSERRTGHFETDQVIAKKIRAALAEELIPIICVGENKETRDAGAHLAFVHQQLSDSIPLDIKFPKLVIAYEPIWSIGTGVIPTAAQIGEVVQFIKKLFPNSFVLYGGSVTSQNSGEILRISGVDGLLVGKASLDAEEFVKIC